MFGFIKNMFIGLLNVFAIGSFGVSLASNYKEPMKCVSLNNQPCKARPTIVSISSDKTLFIHLLISVVEVVTLLTIRMLEFVF